MPQQQDDTASRAPAAPDTVCPVVGIDASAGGLDASRALLRALPADTGMAFVLVQHLHPDHVSMLSEILARETTTPVTQVEADTQIRPNHVYVMPPGADLTMADGHLKLAPREDEPGGHRPVDGFFTSLAQDRGYKAAGVVLSGTSTDGTLGLEEIKAAGGITLAENATAKHDDMPRSAIGAGWLRDGRWSGEWVQTHRDGQKIVVESRMALVRGGDDRIVIVDANRPG